MKILTVITDDQLHGYKNVLLPSAVSNNLDLKALSITKYDDHRSKDRTLAQYLESVSDDEIIFFTDGYDTMFLGPEQEILQKYYKTGKKLLFSAEIVCWPQVDLADSFPPSGTPFRYLNSGGYIGEAGYIRKKITDNFQSPSTLKYFWSNQIYWTEIFLRNMNEIGVDTTNEIFCTLASEHDIKIGKEFLDQVEILSQDKRFKDFQAIADFFNKNSSQAMSFDTQSYLRCKREWFDENFSITGNRIIVKNTGSRPCHVHFNGHSKVLTSDVMEHVNFRYG